MERRVIQVEEKVPILKGLPLSFQHLFAMFGASVLVPFLFNNAAGQQVVDPSLVLLMNGIGTLIYLFVCKGRAPAFLGSSFAFLAPTFAIIASNSNGTVNVMDNFRKAMGGFVISGLFFVVIAFIISKVGTKWLDIVLPPAAMGPIVALIGLELSLTAANNAGLVTQKDVPLDTNAIIVSLFTLAVVVFGTLLFKGFLSVIPVLIAVLAGYGLSAMLGTVDYGAITAKSWVTIPHFVLPIFDINAILIIAPATLVVLSEHIGHQIVTSNIIGRDIIKDPGLHRTLFCDGFSTALSGFCGAVPTTTYGENMGVMAITKVYSVWVIGGAAVISIILAFFGKLSGIITSIPGPVMGGISLFLFGVIGASGIRILVEQKVDYSKAKNLILTSIVFVVGIAGVNDPSQGLPSLAIKLGDVPLKGMALATVVGMILSLLFYIFEKLKIMNESGE